MPSALSPGASLDALSFGSAASSVIALALLPFAPLQAEPRDEDCAEQERNHRRGDGGPFAEMAGDDGALIGERRHQLRRVDGAALGEHPDELEVREREED